MNKKAIRTAVHAALVEDIGSGDITAELISAETVARASIISCENAIICGIPWVDEVYQAVDSSVKIQWKVKDGDFVSSNQALALLTGKARSLVTGERTALNWLQTLSGTATTVSRYVEKLKGTPAHLLDTRKTLPGLRYAQKYAVRCGGGKNHRMGLYDAFLIKENHILSCGSLTQAIQKARASHPEKTLEIEVENLNELQEALAAKADIILLDNFDIDTIKKAVKINNSQAKLEISGNVNLETIHEIAKTGVDYISVGALTKHLRAIDLSMRIY
ncbi:carboxylating nicotinate-nucleotide diphosphorylase [Coxiella burnetii]|uniref:carboxylating nicotinate-nucleotide diphosphorylase n=1 Tax=Coxiella burnetii TaxID=777 RepID=UPI0000ECFE13|nr:carboxylating nicotinate-nucleotide diphosphorylase [Coxiella burnetii]ACJ21064.1 nicotinate-nucleotide pyrophosphorylase (carboxylating) [Coxiella burnetii CbuK_Q154]AIT64138.1 Quinolinate phosphoribosyltransferase [Coxiella burnetii str. Namibia]ATN86649.1 nicotinate-nucleotide pyrophosphorylase [Coxiella burnetii str. Schperling]EAX33427.1 nicotinate-nucleotide diphosphorylase (carboxylating) [Coxiella burnetii 'MSU Goat Q177']EDR36508.1 nicotinate-nucleotide pyrophosphorylase [Coxiella 